MPQLTRDDFEEIFRADYKGLCFFAQNYVKDFEASREIVQDSFISLWEKRLGLDTGRSVKSYLTTTIHNRCLNYLRDNRKFNHRILEIENLLEHSEISDDDFLVEKELQMAIQRAIAELPEKCREVFLLNRYENLKYKEIAEKLGISVKTVEAQMSKALQHLRIKLAAFTLLSIAFFTIVQQLVKNV